MEDGGAGDGGVGVFDVDEVVVEVGASVVDELLAAASMDCPMCQEPIDRSRSITGIVVS